MAKLWAPITIVVVYLVFMVGVFVSYQKYMTKMLAGVLAMPTPEVSANADVV